MPGDGFENARRLQASAGPACPARTRAFPNFFATRAAGAGAGSDGDAPDQRSKFKGIISSSAPHGNPFSESDCMNRKIDIQFVEDAPVEIRAVAASARARERKGGRREFWLGWQLFGAE